MGKKLSTITILVPIYNEEENINEFYKQVKNILSNIDINYEILMINDGSKDKSDYKIRELLSIDDKISYLRLSRNYGKEIAMAAGFDYVKGDAVIIMDADLQDPPELIPTMIQYWQNEYYDDVYAKRISRKGETLLKRFTSCLFYRILQKTTNVSIQKDTGDFRLLSRRALESIKSMKENCRYTKGLFSIIGFKKKEIPFERKKRFAGKTKWNYWKLFALAIEGITSFTIVPLRLATVLGIVTSAASFIYLFILISKVILFGEVVKGYPSLMSVILFLGGAQMISIGIIGEYIGRIFIESKNRPLYFVDEYISITEEKCARVQYSWES